MAESLPEMSHYEWFDFYADKYNEGRISMEGLKASYILRTGIIPQEVDSGTAALL